MAESSRTVRVTGLPTDIEEERLKDKLSIHFLRSRNGGGEIDSVIVVKATPVSALITFEDSGGRWGQTVFTSLYLFSQHKRKFLTIFITETPVVVCIHLH